MVWIRFVKKFPANLPEDAYQKLLDIGTQLFDERIQNRAVRAFWWPRFERIAQWFVDNERLQRQAGRLPLSTETSGKITFSAPGGDFTLNARADRVEFDELGRGRRAGRRGGRGVRRVRILLDFWLGAAMACLWGT